jgi:hypothetical protein
MEMNSCVKQQRLSGSHYQHPSCCPIREEGAAIAAITILPRSRWRDSHHTRLRLKPVGSSSKLIVALPQLCRLEDGSHYADHGLSSLSSHPNSSAYIMQSGRMPRFCLAMHLTSDSAVWYHYAEWWAEHCYESRFHAINYAHIA